MGELSDEELAEQAAKGDSGAFEALAERHYETMYAIAFKWCRNRENAEDITQNACIKLARGIHTYKGNAAFTSWLYRIVINVATDWQRSQRPAEQIIDDALPARTGSAEDDLYAQQVLAEIDLLPEKEKSAIFLIFTEGCTHKEAADIMECKESTVSWYIHEARKKLAERLGEKI